jgi:hypothetical protein
VDRGLKSGVDQRLRDGLAHPRSPVGDSNTRPQRRPGALSRDGSLV